MNVITTLLVFSQVLTVIAIGALLTSMPQLGLDQVQGRAPGLSEHALPFGQTEARAERTLDPARTEKPPLWSVGNAFLPALLSPRRQEWDDKGKALGV